VSLSLVSLSLSLSLSLSFFLLSHTHNLSLAHCLFLYFPLSVRMVAQMTLMMRDKEHSEGNHIRYRDFDLGLRVGLCAMLLLWLVWDCVLYTESFGDDTETGSEGNGRHADLFSNMVAFPVFRFALGLILLAWFWGWSLYMWHTARINWIYIMDLDPHTTMCVNECLDPTPPCA
jgi:hypothetical protein